MNGECARVYKIVAIADMANDFQRLFLYLYPECKNVVMCAYE